MTQALSEAVERLEGAEIAGRRTWGGIDGSGHEDLTPGSDDGGSSNEGVGS